MLKTARPTCRTRSHDYSIDLRARVQSVKVDSGATGPGVTYVKFGELLQAFSTEISIAKDHQMNELDKKLIGIYDEAFAAYKFSATLWKAKNDAHHEVWKGEIPVIFEGGKSEPEVAAGLSKYELTPIARSMPYTNASYKALSATAVQEMWGKADDLLKRATEMYYGRSKSEAESTAK